MTHILFSRALPGVRYMDRAVYIEVTRENNGSAVFLTYGGDLYCNSVFLRWFSVHDNAIMWAATEAHNTIEVEEWKRTHTWKPA